MQTLATIPIVARDVEHLINEFTLRTIHARDVMVDGNGVLTFFYGLAVRRPGRVEIRQTAPDVYSVDVGHIHPKTHQWTVDRTAHYVPGAGLREAIQELT